MLAVDQGNEAVLIHLDYSAAFDTISHKVFLNRLRKTYFTNRSQCIVTNDSLSKPCIPLAGVPQGSVIGPLSFILYTAPLEDITEAHGLGRMIYADDTQVYVVLKRSDHSVVSKLERCIIDIKTWSSANDLKLNEDKIEVIHVSSRFRKSSDLPFVEIADVSIQPVKSARNLGVIFENNLRMDDYTKNICRAASYTLYKIRRIRHFLNEKSTDTFIYYMSTRSVQ